MARRGERIGDAYVRIHADGSAISKEVQKDLDTLDKPIQSVGERHGEGYVKGQAKGIRENREVTNRAILDALNISQGESEKRAKLISGRLMGQIKRQIEQEDGPDVSRAFANILVRGIQEGSIKNKQALKDLLADEQSFTRLRTAAIRDLARLEAEAHTEALKLNREFDLDRKSVV